MVTGGQDGIVGIWDLSEMVCIRTIDRYRTSIKGVSFSYDGMLIATNASAQEEDDSTDEFRLEKKNFIDIVRCCCIHRKFHCLSLADF